MIILSKLFIDTDFLSSFRSDILTICVYIDLWLFRRIRNFSLTLFSKFIFDLSSLSFFNIDLFIRSFIMLILLFFRFLNSIYHIDIHYLISFFLLCLSIFLGLSLSKLCISNIFFHLDLWFLKICEKLSFVWLVFIDKFAFRKTGLIILFFRFTLPIIKICFIKAFFIFFSLSHVYTINVCLIVFLIFFFFN